MKVFIKKPIEDTYKAYLKDHSEILVRNSFFIMIIIMPMRFLKKGSRIRGRRWMNGDSYSIPSDKMNSIRR